MDDAGPPVETSPAARLRSCKRDVIERWTRRVRDDPRAAAAQRNRGPVLVHEVPRLFEHLVEALAASGRAEALAASGLAEPLADEDGELQSAYGRVEDHAHLHAAQGSCIAAALRELSHLRAVLIEVCAAQGIPLGVREAQVLHAVVDASMWTSAREIETAARAALEDSAARLRLATQAGGVGVWDYDTVTGKLRWDDRCRQVSGLGPEPDVDFELFVSAIHPDDRARVQEAVLRSQDPESGGEYSIEYRLVGIRDRIERWVCVQGRAFFDAAGRSVRMLGTVIDISDRKRAEAERIDELAFRDRFLGALSHYLRTPLTSVTLATSVLMHHGNVTPRQARSVERIAASARRMARTIDDLLDLTRSRFGGSIPIAPSPGNLHVLCKGAIDELRAMQQEVPIGLDLQGSGAGLWDPERIAQMVTNLVQNAVDYADPGSAIRVAIRPRGEDVQIEVHNDGPAIAPERLETLFDPWQQPPADGRSSTGRGLGLGLFIAHQIAKAHGGEIEVESKAERGTTFTARLPRREAAGC
ncbi:ATP-binding protein [Sorangium sp. So ce362]|uniref:sensor histidine kinase n=1 Tax=Sorangium sp. So ce362 TaxID=3133303 RepID=UPI003F60A988